jgi:hypothetical protein
VGGTQAGYKVILERAYSAFGSVDAVVVGFNELEAGASLVDGSLDGLGGLVV